MSESNLKAIRGTYDAFARGDTAALVGNWTPDVVWHESGHHQLAGTHEGPEAILGFFGRIFELTDATFRAELEHCLADDVMGYALHTLHAERDGRSYEASDVLVLRFQGGRIAEVWLHPQDQALEDELFA